jgi:hypothetical protein
MFSDLTELPKTWLYYSIAFGLCVGVTLMTLYWELAAASPDFNAPLESF